MRILSYLAIAFALTACATTLPTSKYSEQERNELMQFTARADSARVFFLNGITSNQMVNLRHGFPSSLILNDVVIGNVNKGDVLVADVKPGSYKARWRPPFEKDGTSRYTDENLTLKAGDVVIIRSVFNPGGAGFGLIGALASPPTFELNVSSDRSDIATLSLVRPLECPNEICLRP